MQYIFVNFVFCSLQSYSFHPTLNIYIEVWNMVSYNFFFFLKALCLNDYLSPPSS